MAQLKDLIVTGASRFLNGLYANEISTTTFTAENIYGNGLTITNSSSADSSIIAQFNDYNGKRAAFLRQSKLGNTTATGKIDLLIGSPNDNNFGNEIGQVFLYSGNDNKGHMIVPSSVTANKDHYLPNSTGWLVSTSTTSSAVGSSSQPIYVDANGVVTAITGALTNGSAYLTNYNHYSNSATQTINLGNDEVATGAMFHFTVKASVTGSPGVDSTILQMNWANSTGYNSQFGIQTGKDRVFFRRQSAGTWQDWQEIAHGPLNTSVGSSTQPVYLSNTGTITEGTQYAGGTNVTLNGTSKSGSGIEIYAPTSVGTNGQILVSSGNGAPSWNSLTFNQLPTLYWADVAISNTSSTNTTPTFKSAVIASKANLYQNSDNILVLGDISSSTNVAYYVFNPTHFRPSSNMSDMLDLGSSSYQWKDLYLSGTLYGVANKANSANITSEVNSIAYYSSTSGTFSQFSNIKVLDHVLSTTAINNVATGRTAQGNINGLFIKGLHYGTDASYLASGVAGDLSFGDPGPQIQFGITDTSSARGAIIFTAHNAGSGAGSAFHFVATTTATGGVNESPVNVVSDNLVARNCLTIGNFGANTSYIASMKPSTSADQSVLGVLNYNANPIAVISQKTYGAAGTMGDTRLIIGNGSTVSTEGNSMGNIYLYSASAYSHRIYPVTATANRTHNLPNSTGWLVTAAAAGTGATNCPVYVKNTGVVASVSAVAVDYGGTGYTNYERDTGNIVYRGIGVSTDLPDELIPGSIVLIYGEVSEI